MHACALLTLLEMDKLVKFALLLLLALVRASFTPVPAPSPRPEPAAAAAAAHRAFVDRPIDVIVGQSPFDDTYSEPYAWREELVYGTTPYSHKASWWDAAFPTSSPTPPPVPMHHRIWHHHLSPHPQAGPTATPRAALVSRLGGGRHHRLQHAPHERPDEEFVELRTVGTVVECDRYGGCTKTVTERVCAVQPVGSSGGGGQEQREPQPVVIESGAGRASVTPHPQATPRHAFFDQPQSPLHRRFYQQHPPVTPTSTPTVGAPLPPPQGATYGPHLPPQLHHRSPYDASTLLQGAVASMLTGVAAGTIAWYLQGWAGATETFDLRPPPGEGEGRRKAEAATVAAGEEEAEQLRKRRDARQVIREAAQFQHLG